MARRNVIRFTGILLALFITSLAGAQCPSAAFNIPSPVCAGTPLSIVNNSTGAVSYQWDFSPGYFYSAGAVKTDTTLPLSYPGDIKALNQNDTIVVFLTGKADGNFYRLTYANGPESPLTNMENFGNLSSALYQPGDLDLYQENGNWYGIVVDYGNNSVVRFELGNSLLNPITNVTTLLNNSNSNISTAWGVRVRKDENGNVFGLVANFTSGTITVLNFGNSITNTPVPSVPISTGQGLTLDIELVHSCGHWVAFLAGYNASTIVIADFGTTFSNTPSFSTIITDGSPSDITVVEDSSGYKLLYANYNSHIISKYNLGHNLTSPSPVSMGTETFGGTNPKGISIIRKGLKNYAFLLYIGSNQLKVVSYGNNSTASQGISADAQPSGITFSSEGNYPVTLTAYDSLGNSSTLTQVVNVSASPSSSFTFNGICLGSPTFFQDQSTITSGAITSWSWDFGDGNAAVSQNPSHTYADTGTYTVTLTAIAATGCSNTYTQTVRIYIKPTSNFSTSAATCSRSLMTFTDLSTISAGSIVSWHWNFGNSDTSNVQNPDYIYPTGGTFNVSLTTTSDQGCTNTFNSALSINDRPTALFDALNTCVGQPVQFNDQSTVSNSTIVTYSWDLGDGTLANTANVTHQYSGGVADYNVSLIIVALNSCTDTLIRTVRINNVPTADFTTTGVLCNSTAVQFIDLSTVAGDTISNYFWDFGDGFSDNSSAPSHQFGASGNYSVTLIAYAPFSCPSAPVQHTITVLQAPSPNFTSTIACLGTSTVFTNTSTVPAGESIDSTYWYFLGGNTSTFFNTSYLFPSPGYFNVRLEVLSNSGCRADTTISVKVSSIPVADFSTTNNCSSQQVQFTNLSTNDTLAALTSYSWNFGDPSSGVFNTSALANPFHVFNTAQLYQIMLVATNNYGCSSTINRPITVNQSPLARFTYSPTCYGDQMLFYNPGSAADSAYLWNFGDFQTNQLREPAHYYAFVGNYTVTLTVYAANGCIATATRTVTVSPIPTANFSSPDACLNAPVQFSDISTISAGSITRRKWYVNNVTFDTISASPSYTFTSLTNYTVKLTVYSDIGCFNTATKTVTVQPLPEANFSFTPQFGNPPLDVDFINLSTGASTYVWDFGDGTTGSTLTEPQHQYADTGIFNIQQIAISSYGCKDTAIKSIYVIKPVLDIAVTGDSSYYDGTYFHVVARLSNLGTREISSVKLVAQLDNGNQIKEDYTGLIPNGSGGQISYTFRGAFPIQSSDRLKYYCIKAIDPNNETDNVTDNNEKCFSRTKVEPGIEIFPNPFDEQLSIRLIIPYPEDLYVALYDVTGHELAILYNGVAEAGLMQFNPDVTGLREGIYTLRVLFKDDNFYRQIIKVRTRK